MGWILTEGKGWRNLACGPNAGGFAPIGRVADRCLWARVKPPVFSCREKLPVYFETWCSPAADAARCVGTLTVGFTHG